ncbi:MAG: hypothetical protein VXZ96_14595 [Myxococcota bacterium]|nr:hypothetical protein [Myxococcota bacterium]MEC8381556.1 hypothetical protein [Myxococcota bacterium]
MFNILDGNIELDAAQLTSIAAAMKEMSAVDGEIHPEELAMINQLTEGFEVSDNTDVDVSLFQNVQQKDIFLKSVALVALADGKVLAEEKALLEKFSSQLGLDAGYGQSIMTEVGIALLSYFRGVTVTRSKMEDIGRQLGLGEPEIAQALDPIDG